jgi:hypothetical protein
MNKTTLITSKRRLVKLLKKKKTNNINVSYSLDDLSSNSLTFTESDDENTTVTGSTVPSVIAPGVKNHF